MSSKLASLNCYLLCRPLERWPRSQRWSGWWRWSGWQWWSGWWRWSRMQRWSWWRPGYWRRWRGMLFLWPQMIRSDKYRVLGFCSRFLNPSYQVSKLIFLSCLRFVCPCKLPSCQCCGSGSGIRCPWTRIRNMFIPDLGLLTHYFSVYLQIFGKISSWIRICNTASVFYDHGVNVLKSR